LHGAPAPATEALPGHGSAPGGRHFLLRDRIFAAGVIVWVASLLPSFFPILGPDLTFAWANVYSDAPALLVSFIAAVLAWKAGETGRARSFWALVGASVFMLLLVRAMYLVLPLPATETQWFDLTQDAFYVASYLIVAFALARRPDRAAARGHRGRLGQIELLGSFVFVFGLLGYFIVLPSIFVPESYGSWVPSLAMYVVLDAYLAVQLIAMLRGRVGPEWRWTYRALAAAYGLWFFADLTEGALLLEVVPQVDAGSPLDLLWHLPILCLMIAIRSRGWPIASEADDEFGTSEERLDSLLPARTGLAVLALALPTIHLMLGAAGIREPAADGVRELLLLFIVAALGGLLLRHQLVMRQLATSLDVDRQLVSDQLHISQRMEAVGRLATGVAHDFANILSVIRGRAELLMMTNQVMDGGVPDAREIVEASRRGQSLVTHLLTLGRRRPSEAEAHNLAAIISELQPLLERVLPDSVDVQFSTGERGLPVVHADRAHLEQVILNLVVNARDAMPDGGSLRIHTEVVDIDDHFAIVHGGTRGGEYTLLRVTDSGTGVPPELRHLVFEPFFTTKEHDLGTGLGLSIVYGVARQGHGFVRLSDARGGGAVFEVYLPKARAEPAAMTRAEATSSPRGRETILLVEDYEALRKTVSRVLQESGFRVLEAGTASEALAILERRNERIELLIADLVLPDLSGFELEARALHRLPNLVTVFISGYPEGVTPLRIPESATILEKPFSPEVLTFTVRRVLDERKRFTG